MKVLLIHPPDNEVSLSPGRFEPLGLEVLAATIPGHEVNILDLRIDGMRELNQQLGPNALAIIGVSINNAIHVKQAKKVLAYIRERNPRITLIVGGYHPTMMPQDFYEPCVDVIFHGWAEKSFPEYIRAEEGRVPFDKVPGIEILDDRKPIFHSDPDWNLKASEIPIPRRDLIARYERKYRSDMGFRTSLINTTRGCPSRCSFCGVWQVTGGRFLIRDPEEVFKEITQVPDFIKRIFFADDNTFINTRYAEKLCSLIKASGNRKKFSGYCRSDTIIRHPELMQHWKDIGLDNLCVGFEGIDDDRLGRVNKKNTASNNEAAAKYSMTSGSLSGLIS